MGIIVQNEEGMDLMNMPVKTIIVNDTHVLSENSVDNHNPKPKSIKGNAVKNLRFCVLSEKYPITYNPIIDAI